jgi:hypothetical protein
VIDPPAEAVEAAARALHLDYCLFSTRHDEGDCWDLTEKWERAIYLSNATVALTAAVPSLREAWETELRESGALVLPPNPFGTSATWADYDWNKIAQNVRSAAARGALERIADAVRGVRDV